MTLTGALDRDARVSVTRDNVAVTRRRPTDGRVRATDEDAAGVIRPRGRPGQVRPDEVADDGHTIDPIADDDAMVAKRVDRETTHGALGGPREQPESGS